MYRFSIEGEDWLLRFSPKITIDADDRQAILLSILHIGSDLARYSHGSAFIMFTKRTGAIVFSVERIPSLILTVADIVSKDNWYIQD